MYLLPRPNAGQTRMPRLRQQVGSPSGKIRGKAQSGPPTPSVRRLWLPRHLVARDEPGQGAVGRKIGAKTLARTALRLSPGRPARARAGGIVLERPAAW